MQAIGEEEKVNIVVGDLVELDDNGVFSSIGIGLTDLVSPRNEDELNRFSSANKTPLNPKLVAILSRVQKWQGVIKNPLVCEVATIRQTLVSDAAGSSLAIELELRQAGSRLYEFEFEPFWVNLAELAELNVQLRVVTDRLGTVEVRSVTKQAVIRAEIWIDRVDPGFYYLLTQQGQRCYEFEAENERLAQLQGSLLVASLHPVLARSETVQILSLLP